MDPLNPSKNLGDKLDMKQYVGIVFSTIWSVFDRLNRLQGAFELGAQRFHALFAAMKREMTSSVSTSLGSSSRYV